MSKWLQAARSAKASRSDSGPLDVPAISAISANSPPERPIGTIGAIGKGDQSLIRAALAVVPDLSDPEDIRAWLDERAAMREDSGTPRADAEKVAFDQLLWLWCEANPRQHTSGQCAACGTAFGVPVMSLPDGSQVCDKPDHACLTSYGAARRQAAVGALKGMGIEPPKWWEL